jgi:TM2 domain-containing membrane protein YozV
MSQQVRNPGAAAVLSFVFNGLGQLYNGQIIKGLVIIFLSSLSMLIFIGGSILLAFWISNKTIFTGQLAWGIVLFCLGLSCICVLGIYSIFDAYNVALKK